MNTNSDHQVGGPGQRPTPKKNVVFSLKNTTIEPEYYSIVQDQYRMHKHNRSQMPGDVYWRGEILSAVSIVDLPETIRPPVLSVHMDYEWCSKMRQITRTYWKHS